VPISSKNITFRLSSTTYAEVKSAYPFNSSDEDASDDGPGDDGDSFVYYPADATGDFFNFSNADNKLTYAKLYDIKTPRGAVCGGYSLSPGSSLFDVISKYGFGWLCYTALPTTGGTVELRYGMKGKPYDLAFDFSYTPTGKLELDSLTISKTPLEA